MLKSWSRNQSGYCNARDFQLIPGSPGGSIPEHSPEASKDLFQGVFCNSPRVHEDLTTSIKMESSLNNSREDSRISPGCQRLHCSQCCDSKGGATCAQSSRNAQLGTTVDG